MIDKDEIKNNLMIEDIFTLVDSLGGEPRNYGDYLICKTICHGGESHKLYYYDNSKLFQCYTNCGFFDVFELIQKVKKVTLPNAIKYVTNFFGLTNFNEKDLEEREKLQDWEYFKKKTKKNSFNQSKKGDFKIYDKNILKYFPCPRILDWEKEGITHDVQKKYSICYDPVNQSIIIPHYDKNNNLIGIRERTVVKEQEIYGKYRPMIWNGVQYNHALSFNLYGINFNKKAISEQKKAIILEGEKSVLQADAILGSENNICVACCGSSISEYQIQLLLDLGVKEVIVALDKQFKKIGDKEWEKWVKKLYEINTRISRRASVSFIFDKWDKLGYKDSPTDRDKETFDFLFRERICI